MKFFEPNGKFLDWLACYAGDRITFDVGCGEGHVVRALHKRRVKAIGIDPMWSHTKDNFDLASAVLPMMAEDCSLLRSTRNSLVLFCRPCHNRFVERVLRLLPQNSEALYISLPENLGVDFSLAEFRTTKLATPPCKEEFVWQVSRKVRS